MYFIVTLKVSFTLSRMPPIMLEPNIFKGDRIREVVEEKLVELEKVHIDQNGSDLSIIIDSAQIRTHKFIYFSTICDDLLIQRLSSKIVKPLVLN